MKKILLILFMLFSTITFAQEKSFEDVITPYVEQLAKGVETGVEFVKTEAPIVIQSYLTFEAVRYGSILLLGILFIIFARSVAEVFFTKTSTSEPKLNSNTYKYINIRGNKWLRTDCDNDMEMSLQQVLLFITKWGMVLTGITIISCNILTFIKITWFPKLYLIEQFLNII